MTEAVSPWAPTSGSIYDLTLALQSRLREGAVDALAGGPPELVLFQ